MKRYLFVLTLVVALLATSGLAFAEDDVTVGVGNMKIGGILQSGFIFYIGNEYNDGGQAVDRGVDMAFYIARARLLMAGAVVDERVTWFTQFEFARDAHAYDTGFADILLDMKLGFHYIPYTGIYVGRFMPKFTFFAPRHTGMLMLIDYPLMNRNAFMAERQTGLDFGVVTPYLDANFGVFNGRHYYPAFVASDAASPVGNVGWGEQNNGKDIYLNLVGKPPIQGLQIFAGLWYGTPLDAFDNEDGTLTEQNASAMFFDFGAAYMAPFGLTAIGELLYGTYSWDSTTVADVDRNDDFTDITTMSYYIMVAFNFFPMFEVPVELLVRYDYFDPDTLNDEDLHGYEDALSDIVVGVNYYIKKHHAMLSLNYIHHGEEYEALTLDTTDGDDTQTGVSNDEIKIQAQVSF